jgi:hypothetical protein
MGWGGSCHFGGCRVRGRIELQAELQCGDVAVAYKDFLTVTKKEFIPQNM